MYKAKRVRAGWVHSDLDASRGLGELKSEFVESPPIKISLYEIYEISMIMDFF